MQQISKATQSNWKRLNVKSADRLTARANKTASQRVVVASCYLKDPKAEKLLRSLTEVKAPIEDVMYTLCLTALQQAGLAEKPHVDAFLKKQSHRRRVDIAVEPGTFNGNGDVLGYLYQSLTAEGVRIANGIYYTPAAIASYLAEEMHIDNDGSTVLDPCCGSGSLLMAVSGVKPENLYGFDTDPVAVMIASTNLLLKFPEETFSPKIFRYDFLDRGLFAQSAHQEIPRSFDYIFTNPPWGADRTGAYKEMFPEIRSGERASMVIAESLNRLAANGRACFILPVSLLHIQTHRDVRELLLHNSSINAVHLFDDRFDGVYTRFFALDISGTAKKEDHAYRVISGRGETAEIKVFKEDIADGEIPLSPPASLSNLIIGKMEAARFADLKNSRWALGIVTGDNKNKLLAAPTPESEPIVTGKDVMPLKVAECKKHIVFKPEAFQQCAPEALYRAGEKLIYKFIAKYPVVAYDDRRLLCLNSANIVIPAMESLSAKSACVLLNSRLYRFYYRTRFSDIKVLKSNLASLPFPKLTAEQDAMLSAMLDRQIDGDCTREEADEAVFEIFGLSAAEKEHVLTSPLTN